MKQQQTKTHHEYTINGHVVGCHRIQFSRYDSDAFNALEEGLQAGALSIIAGYPLPVIVINRATTRIGQYLASDLSIDGARLGFETSYVEVTAHVVSCMNGMATQWSVSAHYNDQYRNGRGNGRALYERKFDGEPTQEDVDAALIDAIKRLDGFDYTSTWELDSRRNAGYKELIGDFPELPTRDEYEEKCQAHGLDPRPDNERSYAAEYYDYGVGGFAKLEPIEQLETEIYLRRMRNCVREAKERESQQPKCTHPTEQQPSRPVMICKSCHATGHTGAYPFSTAPHTGLCDDCL